jgi:predicted permease
MPDWPAVVRARLNLARLRPERVEEIVEDLARQLEDAYQEARAGGATEGEAQARAEQHIADWQALDRDLSRSARDRVSAVAAWQAASEDRVVQTHGRLTDLATLQQDLVYGLRTLRRSPGVTAIAVLSLALGIGANTAVFTVMNALLLRPLPVRDPQQLVLLTDPTASGMITGVENGSRTFLSYHEFENLRDHNQVFSGLAAFSSVDISPPVATETSEAAPAALTLVNGDYFSTLGVAPRLGRAFGPDVDHGVGGHPVAVVSDAFWRARLGGSPAAVDHTVRIRQTVFDVIGVMPPAFTGVAVGDPTDLWVPFTMQQVVTPGSDWLTQPPGVARRTEFLHLMGRRRPGVTEAQAKAGANLTFQQGLQADAALIADPERRKDLVNTYVEASDARHGVSELRGQYTQPLAVVMALVGLLLLLASANVANLLLARAAGRSRELSVRVALGAKRSRLIRQLLTESLLLAGIGAALGLGLAQLGSQLLLRMVSGGAAPVPLDAHLDGPVLAFTLEVTVVTGLLFGLVPAFRATRPDLNVVLRGASRDASGTGGQDRLRMGTVLAGAQVAISLVLLITAGLFVRTFQNLTTVPLGYDTNGLVMFRVDLTPLGYAPAAVTTHFQDLLARFQTVPGVAHVSLSANGLFYGGDSGDDVSFPGMPLVAGENPSARFDLVGPDYFQTVGIPILLGRDVVAEDATGLQPAWLNQSMARYFFKDASPVGHHMVVHYSFGNAEYDIKGVVANVHDHALRGEVPNRFYLPYFNNVDTTRAAIFQVRYAGEAAAVTGGLRAILRGADPALGPPIFRTVSSLIDLQLLRDRLTAELSTLFGAFALLLASLGLYGVLSYHVSRRLGEIGVRMALGAGRRSILALVLREALVVTLAGSLVGVAVALATTHFLSTLLFGLTGRDPATIALAVVTLVAVATVAAMLPAWRASRTDPIVVLRGE